MNNNRMYDKIFAIFGTVMVFFYFGLAIFILTTDLFDIDKALRIVLAVLSLSMPSTGCSSHTKKSGRVSSVRMKMKIITTLSGKRYFMAVI